MSDQKLFLKELGQRIADWRNAASLTQKQLGDMAGVSQQIIADYESGRRQLPVWRLHRIAEALGTGIAELVDDDKRKPCKRGPTPKIQKQLEAIAGLPKDKQAFVSEVLTNILAS